MIRLLIFTFLLPIHVIACTCGNFGEGLTIKDYNNSEFIISGKAIKVTSNDKEPFDRQRQIEFKVDEVYKGNIPFKTVMIYTSLGDASCGLYVQENEEWVIWAYLQNNVITTNLCTRSKQKKNLSAYEYTSLQYFKSNPSTSEWKNEQGVTIAQGKLENNMPVGPWKYYYPNGHVASAGSYKNGLNTGKWIKYFDPESIITRLRYDQLISKDSIPEEHLIQNRIWEIQNFKGGKREGEFIIYNPKSVDKPWRILNYKDGNIEGKSIGYYDNGLLYYEQNYKGGKLDGYERMYYPNGQLKQQKKFSAGKATGEYKLYDEAGVLIETVDGTPLK